MKVLVLGAGKMVEAILLGLKSKVDLTEWEIYSPSGVSAKNLAQKIGCGHVSHPSEVVNPDFILLGCKPQQIGEIPALLGSQFKDSLIVSILAALTEEDQLKSLGTKKLIRIMPNLPVAQHVGVSLISSLSAQKELPIIQNLFSHLGKAPVVTEIELEELTLLTGSGPAFFYEFTKNLASSCISLDEKTREDLARQVLLGAALTVEKSDKSLSELTDAVTSKGGVTIAVLDHWRGLNLVSTIKAGFQAGLKRTQELKALLRK